MSRDYIILLYRFVFFRVRVIKNDLYISVVGKTVASEHHHSVTAAITVLKRVCHGNFIAVLIKYFCLDIFAGIHHVVWHIILHFNTADIITYCSMWVLYNALDKQNVITVKKRFLVIGIGSNYTSVYFERFDNLFYKCVITVYLKRRRLLERSFH